MSEGQGPSHRTIFRKVKYPKKRPAGRPKKPIDPKFIIQLAREGNTLTEMACIVDCEPQTLLNRFQLEINLGKALENRKLRQHQLKTAYKGCPQLLIWMGKHRLNQREVIEVKEAHKDDIKSLLKGLAKEAEDPKMQED